MPRLDTQALRQQIIGIIWVTLSLVGCGAPAATSAPATATPSPEPPTATATPAPPTATPTPIPPTPTPTSIPSTATFTPIPPTATPTPIPPVGTDITIELPPGDPGRGLDLADRLVDGFDCTECHVSSRPPAPNFAASGDLPAIGERAALRLADPGYAGAATTPEQYLFESIVLPDAYRVEGRWADYAEMDEDFGERLTRQDVADLIAWLLTLE